MITYTVTTYTDYCLVEFLLPNNALEVADLQDCVEKAPALGGDIPHGLGVVLSGRGPVWLFAALVHEYHASPWVGTYDPRLNGAVVVERHVPHAPAIGAVVPVPMG